MGQSCFFRRCREGRGEIGDDLGNLPSIGSSFRGAVHRLLEASRGHELHRPRNFADVADGLQPFDNRSCFGHE